MNRLIPFLAFFFILFLTACESDMKPKNGITVHRDPDLLPPLEITISPAIKEDAELVDMVESSEKAITEFSDNIERLADDAKVLIDKTNGDEPSLGDGLRLGKIMMSFVSNSSQIQKTIQKLDAYTKKRQEQGTITDEQIEAVDEIGKAFGKRMEELGKKYKYLFDQQK